MGRDDLYITVPSLFRCPISLDVMKSPVSLCTGVTYDRASIQRWLDGGNNTCPATMQVLHSKDLVPNHTLQRLIQIWSDSVRRRSIPGEAAVSSLKQEHLPELVTEIEKMSEQCSECVSRIACFAQESEEKLKFLARVPGFVPALVNILNKRRGDAARENFDLAVKVVRLLDMVAKEYEDKEELMRLTLKGDRDCLSSLLFVLQRGSTESKVGCVRILETIAIDAESKLQIAGKDGLLSELLALVGTESTDQTIIEAGLSCLIAISMPKRIRSQIVSLGAIKLVGKHLSESNLSVSITEKALKLLQMLSSCREGRAEICEDPKCVGAILQKAMKVSNAATEHAVTILWSICYLFRDQRAHEAVTKSNGLTKILLLMQSNCSVEVRQMAGDLLKIFRVSCKSCLSSYDTKTTHIMPF
ncbi:U-box domain-containing protein 27-like isoform X1 [Malania oleifera]|uniref:U-box domain-containing protein 27-like isoform X1 n=1 Tax=Malania oleifera TaxID=397392 RepID=UPI0025AE3CF2|nr:U-box domain-containing protein 27-like isoform X1 [Malania oleifera]